MVELVLSLGNGRAGSGPGTHIRLKESLTAFHCVIPSRFQVPHLAISFLLETNRYFHNQVYVPYTEDVIQYVYPTLFPY